MGNVHMEATQINYRGGSKKMSVEEAIKAAGTEITPEEKAWIDTIPELASQEIIAPEFDAEEGVYAVGDLVIYQGGLYKFTTAHETAGAWNPEEVAAVKVSEELSSLESGLTNETVLLNQLLTTTSTKYNLNGFAGDYMFIAFILGWYGTDSNDNMVVMPSSAFSSNDYLLIPRKNDSSTQAYAKINSRGYADGFDSINAEGTEGVSIKVVGIIHK